jgi:hypothetical protein
MGDPQLDGASSLAHSSEPVVLGVPVFALAVGQGQSSSDRSLALRVSSDEDQALLSEINRIVDRR